MIVEVDGVRLEVPDDATPEEIAALATPTVSKGESLGRGVLQGATLGTSDEIAGIARGTRGLRLPQDATVPGPRKLQQMFPGMDYLQARNRYMEKYGRPEDVNLAAAEAARVQRKGSYEAERDVERAANEAASAANPKTYFAGEVVGGAPGFLVSAPSAAAKGLARLAPVAGQGMLQGAGYSTSDTGTGLLGDTALGGAGGLLGHAAGQGLGWTARGIAGFAEKRLGKALAQATAEKAAERSTALKSAGGSLGKARSEQYRVVDEIRALLTEPNLTPAQRESLHALRDTPEYAQAVEGIVQSLGKRLPDVSGDVAQAETGMEVARALPAVPELAAERVGGKAARSQIMARVNRYGPPMIGSALGAFIGDSPGAAIGALAGAGMRPSIKAVFRMLKDPAVQTQMFTPVRGAARAVESPQVIALRQALARAASIAAMPNASPLEEP